MSAAANFIDDRSVRPLAATLGLPDDQLRLFLVWLIQFPIGWFFHFLVRGKTLRHGLNIVMGFCGMTYFFGTQTIHVVLMSSISWLLMAFLPRK